MHENGILRIGRVTALSLALVGCHTKGAPTSTPEDVDPGSTGSAGACISESCLAVLRLGHYSSGDGLVGLVLDRTGASPKMRLDGGSDIVELTVRPIDGKGRLALKDPSGKTRLFIDQWGGVELLTETGAVKVHRDGETTALGRATIAGTAPLEPPSDYERAVALFKSMSVVETISGLSPADAGNLTKVRAVIEKLDPHLLVTVARDVDKDVFSPSPRTIGNTQYTEDGYWPSETEYDPEGPGLVRYGGVATGSYQFDVANWVKIHRAKGYPPSLPKGTPGMIWNVDGGTIFFVTLDGGRYRLQWKDVSVGASASKDWPAPLAHQLIRLTDVEYLDRAGTIDPSTKQTLDALNREFRECVKGQEKSLEAALDGLAKQNLTWSTRSHRAHLLAEKHQADTEKKCGSHVAEIDETLVRVIEERAAHRREIFELAKRRFR
jgi:hypothetical protein